MAELYGYFEVRGKGHFFLPSELIPHYLEKGKKCPLPSYRLVGTAPNGRLLGSALPSPGYPTPLGSVPQGDGRAAQGVGAFRG